MAMLMQWSIVLFLCVAVLSCGGGGGSGSKAPATPQTPEQALARLSPEDRKTFETWKSNIVKSCNATEVFMGGSGLGESGLDPAVLVQNNENSLIVKGPQGEQVFLGGIAGFSGESNSKHEHSISINGSSYSVQAETKRSGSFCEVFLFGQKVYETHIARSMDVVGFWQPGFQTKASVGTVNIRRSADPRYGQLEGHRFVESVFDMQMPRPEALAVLARHLGFTAEETQRLFRLQNARDLISLRVMGAEPSLWLNASFPELVAPTELLKEIRPGGVGVLQLEVQRRLPQTTYGKQTNTADASASKWLASFRLSAAEPGDNTRFKFEMTEVQYQGLVTGGANLAAQCFTDRVQILARMANPGQAQQRVVPAFAQALDPCETLMPELHKHLRTSGQLQRLLATVLSSLVPSRQADYAGWATELYSIALAVLESGKNLQPELDPTGRVRVIQDLALYLEHLRLEMTRTPQLREALRSEVYSMGFDWALAGERVGPGHATRILQVGESVVRDFSASTRTLLTNLGRDPRSQEEALNFAERMTPEYRAEALSTLAVARALNYALWENEFHNQILQKRPTQQEVRDWGQRLRGLQGQLNQYPRLASERGELVEMALTWLRQGEGTEQDVAWVLAGLNNAIDPFQASTRQLIRDLKRSLAQNRQAVAFAHGLTPEYKNLAQSIVVNSAAIGMKELGERLMQNVLQERPTIERMREMAETMAAGMEFSQREKARVGADSDFFNDRHLKEVLERAVNEAWSRADFITLEHITELGRRKSQCDNGFNKGASSVAQCVGLGWFSRQSGRFLDLRLDRIHGALAVDFVGYLNLLQPDFDYSTGRRELLGAFFGSFDVLWNKCDLATIRARRDQLRQQVHGYKNAPDTLKRWEWEKVLRETVKNCP